MAGPGSSVSLPHLFKETSFRHPVFCGKCKQLLWGAFKQGVQCERCKYISHKKCKMIVSTPCSPPDGRSDMVRFEVAISNVRCYNLPQMDARGLCDPYVVFDFDSVHHVQTPVLPKTYYPHWGKWVSNFTISTVGSVDDMRAMYMRVTVMDEDKFSGDDIVGGFSIDFRRLASGPIKYDTELFSENGEATGRLLFDIEFSMLNEVSIHMDEVHITGLSRGFMRAVDPYLHYGMAYKEEVYEDDGMESEVVLASLEPSWASLPPVIWNCSRQFLTDAAIFLNICHREAFEEESKILAHCRISLKESLETQGAPRKVTAPLVGGFVQMGATLTCELRIEHLPLLDQSEEVKVQRKISMGVKSVTPPLLQRGVSSPVLRRGKAVEGAPLSRSTSALGMLGLVGGASKTAVKNVIREGYLSKLGQQVKNWKRRFFELDGYNHRLIYTGAPGQKLKGGMLMKDVTQVVLVGEEEAKKMPLMKGRRLLFKLVTDDRVLFLSCDFEDEREGWIKVLQEEMEAATKDVLVEEEGE